MNNVAAKVIVDFRSDEPIYLQIARQIEKLVAEEELKIGDQLPTVREMAAELSINFNTVARAYRLLDETRIISTQRGRGTFIWEKPTEAARKIFRNEALSDLVSQMIATAESRGYSIEELVNRFQQFMNSPHDEELSQE
ncbi:MAG: GntR family transcriptional regulator [Leptolinea sp.]|mgnify:CR=1 FL=1|nr:GntR family transcriptional regulator [Leptolinea sp.]